MLALDDGAIALLISTAARFERDADRVAFLKRFAAVADPPPPRADQLGQMAQFAAVPNGTVDERPPADESGGPK
jgi:hypothetical protein